VSQIHALRLPPPARGEAMGVSTHSNRSPGLGSIPVALIYSFFVEYYVEGLTAGSVKS